MQLGYSITSFHPADVPPREAARRVVERAEVARGAGYDYVQAGDHHGVAGGQYLQSVPTAGRLAAVFDHVAAMWLLPAYDPVVVAEQAGTLDALADEFDVWCAVGAADQVRPFGVAPGERGARLVEALALIRRLWDRDGVTFEGEFYRADGVSVNPKADARICIGGSAEIAVRRAGHRGDAWVAGPAEPPEDLEEMIGWFESEGGGDVVVRREALALEEGDRARELADEKLRSGYRGWPADADWVLAGDAEDVAADLEALAELGADEVVVRPIGDAHAEETLREVARGRDLL